MHLNLSQNNYQVANPTSTAFSGTAFRDLSQKFSSLNTSRNAESSPAQVSNFLHQISILQDTNMLSRRNTHVKHYAELLHEKIKL